MRLTDADRDDFKAGADLLAEATGTTSNVSAFVRVAVREKLARLRDEKKKRPR